MVRARGLVAVFAATLIAGCGASRPDSNRTTAFAALVPSDALVFVHVSLDKQREPVKRLAALADRFPSYTRLRDRLVRQLAAPGCDRAQRALKGAKDASFTLFESGGAGLSLVAIDTGEGHDDDTPTACGAVQAAYAGRYLLLGQRQAIRTARLLKAGKGPSLADAPSVKAQLARLPGDRVLDGWVSAAGLRRLLLPQGGSLALAAITLDQPGLRGLAFALRPGDAGAVAAFRSAIDPAAQRQRGTPGEVTPEAVGAVPDGVLAALVVGRLGQSLSRLGKLTGTTGLFSFSPRVRKLLDRPSAVTLASGAGAPVLTISTRTADEADARAALAALPARVRDRLPWKVANGRIVIATRRSGLDAATGKAPLERSDVWRRLFSDIGTVPASSLLFLDFRKLLVLAEQTGLGSDPAYRAIKADLGRIAAIGARSQSSPGQSTVDLSLLIP